MDNPLMVAYNFLNRGGPTMYALVFCSVIMFSIVAERLYSLNRLDCDSEAYLEKTIPLVRKGDYKEAVKNTEALEGFLPAVMEAGLVRHRLDREKIESAMQNTISEQTPLLEGMIPYLGTIAVIAPFLGLLGTITGLIRAFNQIALRGTTGPAVIATGIYEALYTTAAGLIIAIPAVIFYNYFKGRIRDITGRTEVCANKVVEMILLEKQGGPFPGEASDSVSTESAEISSAGGEATE